MLWLVLYGKVMAQVHGLAPGSIPYLDFISPGILAQSVLFVAIFYGISAIWEPDLGVLHRYMGYGNDSVQNGPFGVASSDGISQCWVWAYNATASLQPSSNFQKSRLAGP
jgi:hypothetical protein